jgi:hypothetical protein
MRFKRRDEAFEVAHGLPRQRADVLAQAQRAELAAVRRGFGAGARVE